MGTLETLHAFAPMPAVSRVLAQFDRAKLGAAIEVMIALLDMTEPDADAEGSTWPEDFRAMDRQRLPDDSEDDDPAEDEDVDQCAAGDDRPYAGASPAASIYGSWYLGVGDAEDAEPDSRELLRVPLVLPNSDLGNVLIQENDHV